MHHRLRGLARTLAGTAAALAEIDARSHAQELQDETSPAELPTVPAASPEGW